jgi:hypothetical protein
MGRAYDGGGSAISEDKNMQEDGLFKLAFLLKSKNGQSSNDFAQAWIGIRKNEYLKSDIVRHVYNAVPPRGDMQIKTGLQYDISGVEEIWFADRSAADVYLRKFQDDIQSDSGLSSLVDPADVRVAGGDCNIIVESEAREDDQPIKLLILNKRQQGMQIEDFRDRWINKHGKLVRAAPNVDKAHLRIEYCPIDQLPVDVFENSAFDGLATIQFHNQSDLESALHSDYYYQVLAVDEPRFSDAASTFGSPVKETVIYNEAVTAREITP